MGAFEIKRALKARLAGPTTTIIDELGIVHAIADLVTVNEALHGYEIKSCRDTLKRLPDQVRCYGKVFDYATLVVSWRHAAKALELLPPWWGALLVNDEGGGEPTFEEAREAQPNPTLSPRALVSLLWRDEMLALAREINAPRRRGVSQSKIELQNRILEVADLDTIRAKVRWQLAHRTAWRWSNPKCVERPNG